MNDSNLIKKVMHSITNSSKCEDEREQLESYKISTICLSLLVTLLVISSIIRETIEIHLGDIYPFNSTQEIFFYISLISLVGCYILCKKGAIGTISSLGTLIFGISFPIYSGNILSSILLEGIFSNLQNYQKSNIHLIIIFLMVIFPIVIYFALNRVYKKSIASSEY
ncbi:hypothetical protein [Clostridium vincentii]|uniref:Uncharacterized protein n=1 Tax=Clostridium vincentii TaxID=52704 RepID=A0A2T0BIQ0_9CLOT|nr:hypothetical protein [Clostridium vincentii]PRR83768.1 hypothetical protein CLVI_07150 [Clostridium vincentii]